MATDTTKKVIQVPPLKRMFDNANWNTFDRVIRKFNWLVKRNRVDDAKKLLSRIDKYARHKKSTDFFKVNMASRVKSTLKLALRQIEAEKNKKA